MITATDIGQLIQNPISVSNYDPKALEEIRNKYPYCATLHLLYLKAISLSNDLQFEDHLRFSAAHIIDREQMYYLIHSGEKETTKSEVFVEKTEIVSEKPEKFESVLIEPQNEISEIQQAEEPDELISEGVLVKIDSEKKSEVLEPEKEIADETSTTKELLESAPDLIDLAYESDLADESKIDAADVASRIPETEEETEDFIAETTKPIEPISSIEKPIDLSNLSFVEWLKYKQTKTLPTILPEETLEKQITSHTAEKADTKAEEIKKARKSGLSRFDVDALLNKFIKEEPSISRPQADFYNPVKNAKQSVEESPDLVTETLAKIYVLQKNYSKAIQAYEQLSLVYPEKKTFFASQIKKIKEEQHKQSKQ